MLSDLSFGVEAARAIAPTLRQLTALQHADLHDIIAGRGGKRGDDEVLETLSLLSEALLAHPLVSFDLSDNALGQRGVAAVGPLLAACRASLQTLTFNNDGLEDTAIATIVEHLLPQAVCGAVSPNPTGHGPAGPTLTRLFWFRVRFGRASCRERVSSPV